MKQTLRKYEILLGPQQVSADITESKMHRKAFTPINILFDAQPFQDVNKLKRTTVPRAVIV